MTTPTITESGSSSSRAEQTFPTLTAAQIARIAAHGQVRRVERDDVISRVGDHPPFFAVTEGELQIMRPVDGGETNVAIVRPGCSPAKAGSCRAAARWRTRTSPRRALSSS